MTTMTGVCKLRDRMRFDIQFRYIEFLAASGCPEQFKIRAVKEVKTRLEKCLGTNGVDTHGYGIRLLALYL
jgi:hypothetical protein